ncbi:MAG: hypothetical protein VB934_10705, partial [Polyangiaceae bacterium]
DENADVDGSSATAPAPTDRAVPARAAKDASPHGGEATKAKPRRLATSRKGRRATGKTSIAKSLPWAYETKIKKTKRKTKRKANRGLYSRD